MFCIVNRRGTAFLLVLLACGPCWTIFAQDGPELSIAGLEEKAQIAQADPDLSEEGRARIREIYELAVAEVRRSEEFLRSAEYHKKQRESATEELEETQRELRRVSSAEVKIDPAEDSTVSDMDLGHVRAQVDLVDLQSQLQQLRDEDARRTDRLRQIPEEIAAKRAQLSSLQPQGAAPGGSPAAGEAATYLLQAQRRALNNEIDALLNELLSYEARKRLLPRKIDLAALKVRQQEERVKAWLDMANQARQEEARQAAIEAEETLIGASQEGSQIREVAERVASENAAFVAERTGPGGAVELIEDTQTRLAALQVRQAKLSEAYKDLQTQSDQAESRKAMLGAPLGRVLRRQREELPDERLLRKEARRTERLLTETEAKIADLQTDRNVLADIDGLVAEDLAQTSLEDGVEAADLEAVLVPLYESKRESIQALLEDYRAYTSLLSTLAQAQRLLADLAEEMRAYIDERVLWIRSGARIDLSDISGIVSGTQWLFSPTRWRELLTGLRGDLANSPQAYLLPVLAILILIALRRRIRRRIIALEKAAARRTCENIAPTLEALVYMMVLPLPGIVALAALAWRISVAEGVTVHGLAVGAGIGSLAIILATVMLPRQILGKHGLGTVHFGWPETACLRLRRSIMLMGLSLAPVAFCVTALNAGGDADQIQVTARGYYLIGLLVLALSMYGCIRPSRGALWDVLAQNSLSSVRRRAMAATLTIWAAWLGLFVAAAWGYYYTTQRITGQIYLSLVFGLTVYLLHSVALRWLLTTRRHLAITQARRRREQLKKEGTDTGEDSALEVEQIDLAQVDTQTRRLLRSAMVLALALGLWGIWSAEVPALGIFDNMEFWSVTETVTRQEENNEGVMETITDIKYVPITLGNVFLAVFIAVIGIVLTRNIPGLLEIVLSRRLKLAHGERVAVTTMARYLITAVVIVMSFNAIGIGWGKVQWLVAALSLGLGFGLQEIFANFVSGIILLFERPIRVGDTVTIGDISGNVSRIQIRATTITDWDLKELIVPNKEFITGQLINWSLSDAVLRVVAGVGIDYGADIELAEEILYRVARENSLVLADPAPNVVFQAFGDSTLNFELRIYCANIDNFLPVRHTINKAIITAFREAGISIAFPQMDVHINANEALKEAIRARPAE